VDRIIVRRAVAGIRIPFAPGHGSRDAPDGKLMIIRRGAGGGKQDILTIPRGFSLLS
jgi:hypothetical protein